MELKTSNILYPSPVISASDSLYYSVINKVSVFNNYQQAFMAVKERFEEVQRPMTLSFINAHGYNLCFKNPSFANALLNSDILVRDGKGMEILFQTLGSNPGVNLIGTDFIPFTLERMQGKTVVMVGTEEPYLTVAEDQLKKAGLKVIGKIHGFYNKEEYLPILSELKPEIILLGMGMPKQELLSVLIKENLDFPCLVINGGAIIDYYGNKVSRAPKWMRVNGLEWLYRFGLEPRRMFKRYMIGNILFLKRVRELKKTINKPTKL
jgi:exopolysaccharide biosynthesis WecB/TagA/CpsF family protein